MCIYFYCFVCRYTSYVHTLILLFHIGTKNKNKRHSFSINVAIFFPNKIQFYIFYEINVANDCNITFFFAPNEYTERRENHLISNKRVDYD